MPGIPTTLISLGDINRPTVPFTKHSNHSDVSQNSSKSDSISRAEHSKTTYDHNHLVVKGGSCMVPVAAGTVTTTAAVTPPTAVATTAAAYTTTAYTTTAATTATAAGTKAVAAKVALGVKLVLCTIM
jgi:hypothetical protein